MIHFVEKCITANTFRSDFFLTNILLRKSFKDDGTYSDELSPVKSSLPGKSGVVPINDLISFLIIFDAAINILFFDSSTLSFLST